MVNKITERLGFMSVSAFYVDDDLLEWSALPPFDADQKIAKLKTTIAQREFEIAELHCEIQELQIELINTHSQTHLESLSTAQTEIGRLQETIEANDASFERYHKASMDGADMFKKAHDWEHPDARSLHPSEDHLICWLMEQLHKCNTEIERLKVAFHDAINRPKGTVPTSGDEFYNSQQATKQAT